ncbi:hypothetical protein GQ457_06G014770 [Hibiscus cannabinus]
MWFGSRVKRYPNCRKDIDSGGHVPLYHTEVRTPRNIRTSTQNRHEQPLATSNRRQQRRSDRRTSLFRPPPTVVGPQFKKNKTEVALIIQGFKTWIYKDTTKWLRLAVAGRSAHGLYIHHWVSSLEAPVVGNRHGQKVTGGCWNGGLS